MVPLEGQHAINLIFFPSRHAMFLRNMEELSGSKKPKATSNTKIAQPDYVPAGEGTQLVIAISKRKLL